jgi:hypothetical protein
VGSLTRRLTAKQFLDWEHYDAIEPFGDDRADMRAASIVQMLYNINRGKGQKALTLKDFMLTFKEAAPKKEKTWQEMAATARLIASIYNASGVTE